MISNNKVLVVAAHSDDEVLGCGGTIAKHVDNGDNVYVVFMTDGVASRPKVEISDCDERVLSSENALRVLGAKQVFYFDFPDNQMDSIPLLLIAKKIESVVEDIAPNIVYTHFSEDLNIDHQMTHKAVLTACRPQVSCSVKEIYCFEVLSSTEWNTKASNVFLPQKIVDISQQWEKKCNALECYAQEMRPSPHSRSFACVDALARLRGANYGLSYAEAFFIERIIE